MEIREIVGYLAAVLTTTGFVPQLVKTIKTRQTQDVSLWMYIIMALGVILWLSYGICNSEWPIILANIVSLLLILPILFLKLFRSSPGKKFQKRKPS